MNTQLEQIGKKAFLIGAAASVVSVLGALFGAREAFFEAYLVGFLLCVSVPLGVMVISLVHYLSYGAWGFVIRRQSLAATRTIPWMAILLIPLFLGIKSLYLWANPEAVAADPLLQLKSPYLNVTFFMIRAVFYFAVWIILSKFMERKSIELLDQDTEEGRMKLQLVSGLSLLAFIITMTFAAFDWAMSIEPLWFSTIFGIFTVIGQSLMGLAFLVVMVRLSSEEDVLKDESTVRGFHDLGNLILALVMLWAYMAFSQFFIIWSGNLPEEIGWYIHRLNGGWQVVGSVLAIFHFFVPFFLLLNRTIKRSVHFLAMIALFVLVMRFVDIVWIILPTFRHELLHLSWLHFTVPVGMGGLWFAFYVKKLREMP